MTKNPYTLNFLNELKDHYTIVNENDKSSIGIMNTLKYLFTIDMLLMNWIENLPDNRGGYVQSCYFIALVYFLKFRRKKLIWIMHNKLSHAPKNLRIKRFLFKLLLAKSDLVVTHAKEGISFAKTLSNSDDLNVHHFPHPIVPAEITTGIVKEIDILIWGSLAPYKGIDGFLRFLYQNKLERSYNIQVVGKITSEKYREILMNFQNDKIHIEDRFIEREDLEDMVRKSRVVLFTYSGESILCSGALIDSLSYGAAIVGPRTGNFKDLSERGMIQVFTDYYELIAVLDKLIISECAIAKSSLERYFEETSWKRFVNKLSQWIAETNCREPS